MGSRFSQERTRSPHQCSALPCRFPVSHVDHDMRTIVRGHLEVNESTLAFLHPENGRTLRLEWPFAVIRNYGCTIDWLFMIEVGRRSSTGEGYFFFKSCQASTVSDCLEQHLNLHNDVRRHKSAAVLTDHLNRQRRRRCAGGNSALAAIPSAPPFLDGGGEKDGVASGGSTTSPSGSPTSYGDSNYARSRSVSTSSHERHPAMAGAAAGAAPSGGYVIPVFQHQDSSGDFEDEEDEVVDVREVGAVGVAHEYMNAEDRARQAPNYVNAIPLRPERPRRRSSGVEYSTVIADGNADRLLGNDYANLPSLDTLPPYAVGQDCFSYEEL